MRDLRRPLRSAAAAALALGLATACARVMSPPGWEPDKTPPQLVSSRPEQLAVIPDFKGDVVFKFDERISEKGISDQTAVISPDTGLGEVKRHGSEIRVHPRGGWQPGRIYHVVLLPTVQDMFSNVRREPVEVVFSTGPAIPRTVIAGMLTDRLTGKPMKGALVQAVHAPDSLVYTTASDSAGFFALRFLPEGSYQVRAFDDRSRDRHVQFREAQGAATAALTPPRDTVIIQEISLLPGDTTPARLTRAEARDSTQIRLTFDDFLHALTPARGASATLWRLPDSVRVAVGAIMPPKQFEAMQPRPAADTSARARAAADSTARARAAAPDTAAPLPQQELVLVAGQPLAPRTRYRVTVSGITNVNDIPGGGGSATFETAAPPPPPAPRDSTARARPAGAAPGDSTRRPPARDTTRSPAARDTTRH